MSNTIEQENDVRVDPQPCPVCKGNRRKQARCQYCVGTGHLVYVGWAETPWSQVAPGLWVGAHDYEPEDSGELLHPTVADWAQADFDVVVSLYERDQPVPPGVVHHSLMIPDDLDEDLHPDEVSQVHWLAQEVVWCLREGASVLVRCQAGLNRSSLVAALAMVLMGASPDEVIETIREKRSPFALFNPRFVGLIRQQEVTA